LNNPGRFELMDLAEDFWKRAKELEAQPAEAGGVGAEGLSGTTIHSPWMKTR
jgi:hypothetical protein